MTDLEQEVSSQVNQISVVLTEENAESIDGTVEAQDFIKDEVAEDINGDEENLETNLPQSHDHQDDESEVNNDSASNCTDTTAEFLQVFQGQTEFNSWAEFHTLFEKFQRETGSAFKPRSVTSIEYANERRVKDTIPDHFVYQTVKMVCAHYGIPNPVRKEGSKPRKKYVGLGCEAMVHLRYKAGTLNIVGCNLEHKNHQLFTGTEVIRSMRSFSFSDDIDLLMAKVVMEHNPFLNWNSEKEWMALVADLQSRDARMKTVTVRVVKKRIRFLIERYMSNSEGKAPLPDDEMGIILYELAKARQEATDRLAQIQRRTVRKRGRPRKYPKPVSDDELVVVPTNFISSDKYLSDTKVKYPPLSSSHLNTIAAFLQYLDRKNNINRRLMEDDIDLKRGELELHRKQFELQRERFEFERHERQVRLDLLKAQVEMLTPRQEAQHSQEQKLVFSDAKENGTSDTEYTIVVNNNQTYITQ